jgi:hypothetical protein
MEPVVKVLGGILIGGFLGWFAGVSWYELVEIPRAASMDFGTAPSHLCAAGAALQLLAIPGAFLGMFVGIGAAIGGAEKNQAGDRGEDHDQP